MSTARRRVLQRTYSGRGVEEARGEERAESEDDEEERQQRRSDERAADRLHAFKAIRFSEIGTKSNLKHKILLKLISTRELRQRKIKEVFNEVNEELYFPLSPDSGIEEAEALPLLSLS